MTANHCKADIFTVISMRRPCARISFLSATFYAKIVIAALIFPCQNAVIPFFVIKHLLLIFKIHCRSPYYMLKNIFFACKIFFVSIIINLRFFFNSFSPIFLIFFIFSTKPYKMQTAKGRGLNAFCLFRRIFPFSFIESLFRPSNIHRAKVSPFALLKKVFLSHNITLYAKRWKTVHLFFLYFFYFEVG